MLFIKDNAWQIKFRRIFQNKQLALATVLSIKKKKLLEFKTNKRLHQKQSLLVLLY